MSRQRNDLCRLRRARIARKSPPALPVSSAYPVSLKLRNRIALCVLSDWQSPMGESCGPVTPAVEWRCDLRKSLSWNIDIRGPVRRNSPLSSRGGFPAALFRPQFHARHAGSASGTDDCFLFMSDHGKINARSESQRQLPCLQGLNSLRRGAGVCRTWAVFHSKETGSTS